MTTTFDGSTGGGAHAQDESWPLPDLGIDTLDLLRDRARQHEQEVAEDSTTFIDVPGKDGSAGIRLVCLNNIQSTQITKWQRKALPAQLRKSPQFSPLAIDQTVFHTTVLVETCERLEVRGPDDTWRPVTDGAGEILSLRDPALLRHLDVLDASLAIKKLFVRDSDIARAGQRVLAASGWSESGGEDELDPR